MDFEKPQVETGIDYKKLTHDMEHLSTLDEIWGCLGNESKDLLGAPVAQPDYLSEIDVDVRVFRLRKLWNDSHENPDADEYFKKMMDVVALKLRALGDIIDNDPRNTPRETE